MSGLVAWWEWDRDSKEFRRARGTVARILKWQPANVMDWEVRSYLAQRFGPSPSPAPIMRGGESELAPGP